ncbi:MAG: C25 family cysteine peptidase, partial [Planctomycetota bacterium]
MNPSDLEVFYPEEDSYEPNFQNAVAETSHATGFDPTDRPSLQGSPVDMVILTEDSWIDGTEFDGDMTVAFQVWADWRTKTGTPTVVRTLSWIREIYTAGDDPERIREFLKEAYSLWGTDFVILGGDVEVIPSRTSLYDTPQANEEPDPSSDWYYAGLDSDWDSDDDGFYSWTFSVDAYPELWIGRIPARDSAEAADIVKKLQTYERIPDLGLGVPPDSFYTKALLVGGVGSYGGWEGTEDGTLYWGNGIYQAEYIKTHVMDSVGVSGFSSVRLFPSLGDSAGCGGGNYLECYKDIKDAFDEYPPGPVFTAVEVRDQLQANASIFYHLEHSAVHGLGGPVQDRRGEPIEKSCVKNAPPCMEAFCSAWVTACSQQYYADPLNNFSGISREILSTLSNGPSYFVGASLGCSVGRFDQDSVVETLVRDPDGGAVSMWGGSTSTGWWGTETGGSPLAPGYYDYILKQEKPTGVGLYNAIIENDGTVTNYYARLKLHLFGDPSMVVWTAAPESLKITSSPDCFPDYPSSQKMVITVKQGTTPEPGARVCLKKGDDIYALGWTDDNGEAIFPSVFFPNLGDRLDIWATASNRLPAVDSIKVSISLPGYTTNGTLVYNFHEYSDNADSSATADLLEPGDLVDLKVNLINHTKSYAFPGVARLGITPRVKASLFINDEYEPDSIKIGINKHHPPAGIDTFSLKINEYAMRPELEPNMPIASSFYVWLDTDFIYHIKAHYDSSNIGDSFSGVFITEGGIDTVQTSMEGSDEVAISSSGILDMLSFDFTGDEDDDEILFMAQAQEWIETTVDSAAYDTVSYILAEGNTTDVDFQFRINSGMPPEWRLNMTVSTDPDSGDATTVFSDFYTTVYSPNLTTNLIETDILDNREEGCTAPPWADSLFSFTPRVWNSGRARADSILLKIVAQGDSVAVCQDSVWMDLDAGEEAWSEGMFKVFNNGQTLRFTSLTIAREIYGQRDTLEVLENLNPWPRPDNFIEVSSISADAMLGGLRLMWDEPADTSGILGYYVYRNSSSVEIRVNEGLLTDSRIILLPDLDFADFGGDTISYIYGVSAVTTGLYEGPIVWTGPKLTTYEDRAGWPVRVPGGCVNSVILANVDRQADLEIIVGGRVISAWNLDGSVAIGGDGTFYDPMDDFSDSGLFNHEFHGDLAAGDIDDDGKIEIVGCYGDSLLLAIDTDGDLLWSVPVYARSTPTLADLDGDDKLEVIINSYNYGELYIFRYDGTSYCDADTTGLFGSAQDGDTFNWYNYSGVAVANLDEDNSLEIIQPLPSGWLHAWDSDTTDCADHDNYLWIQSTHVGSDIYSPTSTPVIGYVDADTVLDVVVQVNNVQYEGQTYNSQTHIMDWDYSWYYEDADTLVAFERPPQPSLAELGGDDNLEVVFCQQARDTTDNQDHSYEPTWDPMNRIAILYRADGDRHITTCKDSIPIPGRRKIEAANTLGSPIIADIDGDGNIEIIAASDQGGLFCWETQFNADSSCFECRAEKGWPIVFPEMPGTPAIADLDDDGYVEMVVPVGDYIHVYDLPGVI